MTESELKWLRPFPAATILAIVGDIRRFPTQGHFAAFNGTAPLEASSGEVKRHRLNRGGNRDLNNVLHIAAVVQITKPTKGQAFYRRKLAEGKSKQEALRALKRQLSDVVYRRLKADARRHEEVRGRTSGNETLSA